ncbi:hypothetical protein I588_04293 [Enterococcus pallens ATCC BAA-351]|uniref:Uncharacterized protein n=2 Tax=Enterococcus pallens TaxID=160454 RepID=R2Q3Y3_9ENTE|nr:hypothetical protein UAU_03862 [Enterococcus pallens ATCC BAA-351]EOU15361.1 hypothetical protein I588_04293 [Enterococcus pallens ATCC BAA-351]OJG76865.1 hypothetical protein RV10_GL003200 [Enterococcus pallens]
MQQVEILTVGQLREFLADIEKQKTVTDDTKVFLDTGWDSIQEITSDALSIEEAKKFQIEDPLNHEVFQGYSLLEKAEKMKASGPTEKVLIIRNLY